MPWHQDTAYLEGDKVTDVLQVSFVPQLTSSSHRLSASVSWTERTYVLASLGGMRIKRTDFL